MDKDKDSAISPDQTLAEKNEKKKKEDEEKLEQAKALMREAKDMASQASNHNKEELEKKIKELSKLLELPPDWNKQLGKSPEDALAILEKEITMFGEYIDTRPRYNSLEEVVSKASGGRALTGIIYSEYAPTETAPIPILEPPSKVESLNPNIPYEAMYLKFTSQKGAARFVETVKSSGFDIAVAANVFLGFLVGNAGTTIGSRQSTGVTINSISSCTSAAASHYIRIGTQAFRIKREEMMLSKEAKDTALLITEDEDAEKQTNAARHFFSKYGSHIPCGVHNLGGMFITTANAQSCEETDLETLTHQAAKHLETDVSFGVVGQGVGFGISVKHESHDEIAERERNQNEDKKTTYSHSLTSIGPNAENPTKFRAVLSNNNSTWAILDRGPESAYVPVWKLFQKLGKEYEKAANVMEQTWNVMEDELKKKQIRDKETNQLIDVGSVISLRTKISKKILTVRKNEGQEAVDIEYDNNHKVWARWKDNLYYPGNIESVDNESLRVRYDDKDAIDIELTDIDTDLVPDVKPDPRAVMVGTQVIGENSSFFNREKHRYYPGQVTKIEDQEYHVKFQNDDKRELTLENMRLIHKERGLLYNPGNANECKVWARWTNGLYYPGKIESVDKESLRVHYDDGDVIDIKLRDIDTDLVPDVKPDPRAVTVGTEVIGENREKHRYYQGKVTKIDKKDKKYHVQFQNEDKEELTLENMRLIPNGSSLFKVQRCAGSKCNVVLKSYAFPEYFLCVQNGKLRAVKKKQIDGTCHFKVFIDKTVCLFPADGKNLKWPRPNDTPFEVYQPY